MMARLMTSILLLTYVTLSAQAPLWESAELIGPEWELQVASALAYENDTLYAINFGQPDNIEPGLVTTSTLESYGPDGQLLRQYATNNSSLFSIPTVLFVDENKNYKVVFVNLPSDEEELTNVTVATLDNMGMIVQTDTLGSYFIENPIFKLDYSASRVTLMLSDESFAGPLEYMSHLFTFDHNGTLLATGTFDDFLIGVTYSEEQARYLVFSLNTMSTIDQDLEEIQPVESDLRPLYTTAFNGNYAVATSGPNWHEVNLIDSEGQVLLTNYQEYSPFAGFNRTQIEEEFTSMINHRDHVYLVRTYRPSGQDDILVLHQYDTELTEVSQVSISMIGGEAGDPVNIVVTAQDNKLTLSGYQGGDIALRYLITYDVDALISSTEEISTEQAANTVSLHQAPDHLRWLNSSGAAASVTIYTTAGRVVRTLDLSTDQVLDFSHYLAGSYFYAARSTSGRPLGSGTFIR